MRLIELLETYRDAITRAVVETYPPLFLPQGPAGAEFQRLLRRPLGGQADAIRACVFSLTRQPATTVVGEMGTGKSLIAASAAYLAGCRRVLVLCPPHLTRKWEREVQRTVPGAQTAIVRSISDLERSRRLSGPFVCVILSRERAKLGPRWRPAAIERHSFDVGTGRAVRHRPRLDAPPVILRQPCCPNCASSVVDDDGVPLQVADLAKKKASCRSCHAPLWSVDRHGPRRAPLADYIRQRLPGHFDLLIGDEVHEFKAKGSAQGIAAGALSGACKKTLSLSGTLMGGYSSTLFYLLQRFSPQVRREFGYHDEDKWIARYGIIERVTKRDAESDEDGRTSRRKHYQTRIIERPGITPAVLFHLIGNTVFLRLADVARDLPPYTEHVYAIPLDQDQVQAALAPDGRALRPAGGTMEALSQADAYQRFAAALSAAVREALQQGSKRLLGIYLQALLGWVDNCVREEIVLDPADVKLRDEGKLEGRQPRILAYAPALPDDHLYPKERALLELCQRERSRGRRVLVYITHTETRDLSPRLVAVLARARIKAVVLKSSTVPPEQREEWVAARVQDGAEVLIVHPRLVQTGLDLIDWPSIVFYQPEYSVYVMRQASRRSWRIGQRRPVEVTYLTYERTLQATALALVAAKLRSSLMVEGELPEDGLAALEGDGQDMFLELARKLTEQGAGDEVSLEAVFQQAREFESQSNDALVDPTLLVTGSDASQASVVGITAEAEALAALVPGHDVADSQADDRQATADIDPDGAIATLAGARSLSFLELRQQLARHGDRTPKSHSRKPAPGQLSLF